MMNPYAIPTDAVYVAEPDADLSNGAIRPAEPSLRVVYSSSDSTAARPLENQAALIERVFSKRPMDIDPTKLSAERAQTHKDTIDVVLQHLAARHAISDRILGQIDNDRAELVSRLYQLRQWGDTSVGMETKQECELQDEMIKLSKERSREELACWRDTQRVLANLLEQWEEHAEQERKARLMNLEP